MAQLFPLDSVLAGEMLDTLTSRIFPNLWALAPPIVKIALSLGVGKKKSGNFPAKELLTVTLMKLHVYINLIEHNGHVSPLPSLSLPLLLYNVF